MYRKRHRRRQVRHRNNRMKNGALSVMVVICLSVLAGYMTATQIIGPALGLDAKPSFFQFMNETREEDKKEKENTDEKTVLEDSVDVKTESGYALQYGSFTTEQGAQECVDSLEKSGIKAEIINKDGMFKVIGQLFDTKDEARTYMEDNTQSTEVFITEIP